MVLHRRTLADARPAGILLPAQAGFAPVLVSTAEHAFAALFVAAGIAASCVAVLLVRGKADRHVVRMAIGPEDAYLGSWEPQFLRWDDATEANVFRYDDSRRDSGRHANYGVALRLFGSACGGFSVVDGASAHDAADLAAAVGEFAPQLAVADGRGEWVDRSDYL
ncbi:hypothetical protein [Yinghuangia soli]|uniref:Uncharacterized protein n=1 Tax=Yinghuangia soli TaxID=2908204 RepID=A0AA41Q3B5_9ACTN|nr:hypothetical protein [Yinghuangia soli]MCF2530770.1 hypothetical protein [Yinghuangia soli]